jgi:hypothetical protein
VLAVTPVAPLLLASPAFAVFLGVEGFIDDD